MFENTNRSNCLRSESDVIAEVRTWWKAFVSRAARVLLTAATVSPIVVSRGESIGRGAAGWWGRDAAQPSVNPHSRVDPSAISTRSAYRHV
ncbi:unnamed protein product [Colias eurytheme]|nr:unnamed protein product [Colias eurytheme]